MTKLLIRLPLISAAFATLLSCVAGQSLDMDYQADNATSGTIQRDVSIALIVDDARPYVLSGDKPRYYIGKYRAGFGIPYDVSTVGDVPLADLIHRDIREDLVNLGFDLTETPSDRSLQLTILDWNFDTYQNGTFSYVIDVSVFDQNGNLLIEEKVEKNEYVKGTFWTGGKGGFERAMPGLYQGVIRAIVRENPEVISALD